MSKPLYVALIPYEGYTEFRTEDGRTGSDPCGVEELKQKILKLWGQDLEFEVL